MELSPLEIGYLADYVKEKNLGRTNQIQDLVRVKKNFYTKYLKRLIDIIISLFAIIITLPVNIIIGIITYFDVGQPIFFIQERPGKDCKLFKIVKFRNMREAYDKDGFWLPISERVTKFGSFVRKTSLDELLNFYSILKGDMSIIGPRPLSTFYIDRYSDRHIQRHAVRPGLECPNIKKGYSQGWHEQFENDVWYVEHISFMTDIQMLFSLFRMVFDSKTRKEHAVKGPGDFIGYDEEGHAFGANNVPEKYIRMLEERRRKEKEENQ